MTDPGKAVFLSYASEDAEAAQQLCNALRAAGIEVWFDRASFGAAMPGTARFTNGSAIAAFL